MPKYLVSIPYHCAFLVKVEAENKEQAIRKADTCFPNLCHQCSDEIEIGEANDSYDADVQEI
jgi:hypothetical protein